MKTKSVRKQDFIILNRCVRSFLCLLLTFAFFLQTINAQNNPASLKGKSSKVSLVPNTTVNAGEIRLESDSDNDGMSDGDEARNGTNPDDPSDADGDLDGDGVTNGEEVARGTDPNSADTDGDGVSDAEEIRLGYNPLDPNDTPPPSTTIVSLQISPNPVSLSINTVFGATPVQLTVTGVTSTGTTVNLTGSAETTYESLDQSIAAVDPTGSVFGIADGTTTIRVRNGNLTANVTVNAAAFTPGGTAAVSIPGYANNVDVAGNYAYVAAGSAGLQILDITDRNAPYIAASLDTTGNADDVRVVGNLAYVADGAEGLKIINISDPLNPVLTGSFDTPGEANDVVVAGTTVYVADGLAGLQIINAADPSAPQLIGAIDTPGKTRGVDVSGNYAILAEGTPSNAVRVVNIADPSNPQITGSVAMSEDALDVVVRGSYAYIAGWQDGLKIVEFADPSMPSIVSSYPSGFNGFRPRDVVLNGDFLIAAETVQSNFVPFFDVGLPSELNYRGGVDLTNMGFVDGTGIAADNQFVYTTNVSYAGSPDKGTDDYYSQLLIARYRLPANDENGIAPTVTLTSPGETETVREGKTLYMAANASDDVYVAGVQFKVNGNVVHVDSSFPYEFYYTVPLDSTALSVTAAAFDLGGNISATQPVTVSVEPDSPPTVSLTAPAENTVLIAGESITLTADAVDDEWITEVSFSANGAEAGISYNSPYETPFVVPDGINSLTIETAATDSVGRTTITARAFQVVPDPNTIVTGRITDASGQPIAGANVSVFNTFTAQTAPDGTFSIANVPTIRGVIQAKAAAIISGVSVANASLLFAPVRGGTTNVGDISLDYAPTAPTVVAAGYFGSRDDNAFYGQDLFVGYNNRLSSVYSFNGTEFVPRSVEQLETGAVIAGTSNSSLPFSTYGDRIFVQRDGEPGFIAGFNTDQRDNITQTQIATQLAGESEYISRGYDYATGNIVTAFMTNDQTNGAIINLKIGNENIIPVPLPSGLTLHSLVVSDIDSDGYADILAIRKMPDDTSKLILIKRTTNDVPQQFSGNWSFEPLIESNIIDRVAAPSNGLNNLIVGNFSNYYRKQFAVLGDDRVRIYNLSGNVFEFQEEVILPAGEIPTGGYAYSLSSSLSDLLITTKNASNPAAGSLFLYFREQSGGCQNCTLTAQNKSGDDKKSDSPTNQNLFDTPLIKNYTISNSIGDTRILVGDWRSGGGGGGVDFTNQLDILIIDGDKVVFFPDISPVIENN